MEVYDVDFVRLPQVEQGKPLAAGPKIPKFAGLYPGSIWSKQMSHGI